MSFSRPIQLYHSHADPIWPDGNFNCISIFLYSADLGRDASDSAHGGEEGGGGAAGAGAGGAHPPQASQHPPTHGPVQGTSPF